MHNVCSRKPMRGERYVCWHIGCRYTDPLLWWSQGVPPQGLGKTAKQDKKYFTDFNVAVTKSGSEEVASVVRV